MAVIFRNALPKQRVQLDVVRLEHRVPDKFAAGRVAAAQVLTSQKRRSEEILSQLLIDALPSQQLGKPADRRVIEYPEHPPSQLDQKVEHRGRGGDARGVWRHG